MNGKNIKRLIVTVASGAILLNGGLVACSKMQSADDFVAQARQHYDKGESKAAIIELKNAIQKNPDNAEARFLLATIYNESDDAQSAEKEFRKALSLGADKEKVIPGLAAALLKQNEFQKVLDELSGSANANSNVELATLRGNALLGLRKMPEAKSAFQQALSLQADHADALIGISRMALMQKDLESAAQLAERAVNKNPKNPGAWIQKADVLIAKNDLEGALSAYDQVLGVRSGDAAAHISKAGLEIQLKRFDAAKANIDAAAKALPGSPVVLYTRALLDYSQQKPAAALESLQQVLKVAPDHPPTNLLAAASQLALGAPQQAEAYAKKYLAQNPKNPYAQRILASALLQNGRTEQAISIIRAALKDAPKDAQLLSLAGEAYMSSKEYRKASEYFEQAAKLAPEKPFIRTALGVSRLAQGDNVHGISDLEISADLDPAAQRTGAALVMIHLRNKDYDKALSAIARLEKARPDDPFVHNLKGGAYAAKNDLPKARKSFEKALSLQATYFPAVSNLVQLDVQEKKLDAAKQRLESFIATDKKNIQAIVALAGIARLQGRNDEVASLLERASNENSDNPKASLPLGAHYLQSGEKDKALLLARRLHTSYPRDPGVLDFLGQAQLKNDDKQGALESYNKLAALAPNSEIAQLRLAGVHALLNDEAGAISALKKALELKPDYQEAQQALAAIEARRGSGENALSIARKMQQQAPKSAAGFELEGDIQMQQKKLVLATKAFEDAYTRNKSPAVTLKLYRAYHESGKEKEAAALLAEWTKANPADTSVRLNLGTAKLMSGQYKAAAEQFETVLKQDPKNLPALNNLANVYQYEKDPRALEYAEKAHQLASNNPSVMDTLGWILVEKGDIARGLPLLQKAAAQAPASLEIRYHLAAAMAKSGDHVAARKELAQVLDSGKPFASVQEAKALQKTLQ